jgi:hypothetical protein
MVLFSLKSLQGNILSAFSRQAFAIFNVVSGKESGHPAVDSIQLKAGQKKGCFSGEFSI